jgi:hypothetical protein
MSDFTFYDSGGKQMKANYSVSGDTGISMISGIILEEYNSNLKGYSGRKILDRMRKNDGLIAGFLRIYTDIIRSVKWNILSFSRKPKDEKMANAVWYALNNMEKMTFDSFITQTCLMFPFGFSMFARYFSDSNKKRLPNSIKKLDIDYFIELDLRHPKSIYSWAGYDGNKNNIRQVTTDGKFVDIPKKDLVLFVNRQEGENYEGISILRPVYRAWFYKEVAYKLQMMSAELHSKAIPVGTVPASVSKKSQDYQKFKEMLRNFTAHPGGHLLKPSPEWIIEILDMKSYSVLNLEKIIKEYNEEITNGFLLQFMSANAVSASAVESIAELFYLSIQASIEYIKQVVDREIIKPFIDVNYNNIDGYPKLTSGKAGIVNQKAYTQAVKNLFMAGLLTPNTKTENHVRKDINLPELDDDEINIVEKGGAIEKPSKIRKKDFEKNIDIEDDDEGEDDIETEDDDKLSLDKESLFLFGEKKVNILVDNFINNISSKTEIDKKTTLNKLLNDCFSVGKNIVCDNAKKPSPKTNFQVKELIKSHCNKILAENITPSNVMNFSKKMLNMGIEYAISIDK